MVGEKSVDNCRRFDRLNRLCARSAGRPLLVVTARSDGALFGTRRNDGAGSIAPPRHPGGRTPGSHTYSPVLIATALTRRVTAEIPAFAGMMKWCATPAFVRFSR